MNNIKRKKGYFVILGSENFGIMQYVQPCLAAVPQLLMPYLPSFVNLLFTGLIAISTQALPAMSMFCFLILTTGICHVSLFSHNRGRIRGYLRRYAASAGWLLAETGRNAGVSNGSAFDRCGFHRK